MIRKGLLICLLLLPCSLAAKEQLRIITLAPHLVEIVFALEAGEQIVATSEHSDYPEEARKIRTIGSSHGLSMETIIGLQPDIVLAWRTGNPELQLQRLADLGVKIFYSKPESIDDLLNEITIIGQLIGTEDKAATVVQQLRAELTALEEGYAAKSTVRLFYQIWHQPLRTVGNDPWVNELLQLCGASNVFADLDQGFPLVGYESILAADPEAIIIPGKDETANSTHWQRWTQIKAVKNAQIYQVNPDRLHRFTPRISAGVRELCGTINKVRQHHTQ